MLSIAIVDTGPLYAVVDADDVDHARCRAVLERSDLQLVVPSLVVAEACYLVGTRLGARAEAALLRGLNELEIECPAPGDWQRIAELVERHADFPLGATDASVVALAERLDTAIVVTLDLRHFSAVRPRHVAALTLLPQTS
jgi:predicted nucleic acid-binding protein